MQDLENEGYQFEAAEASFDLLVARRSAGTSRSSSLDHYRVVGAKTDGSEPVTEATVKLTVDGDASSTRVSEGDGPVNALDGACARP